MVLLHLGTAPAPRRDNPDRQRGEGQALTLGTWLLVLQGRVTAQELLGPSNQPFHSEVVRKETNKWANLNQGI